METIGAGMWKIEYSSRSLYLICQQTMAGNICEIFSCVSRFGGSTCAGIFVEYLAILLKVYINLTPLAEYF